MTRILVSALTTAVRRREWFFRCWCNAADDAERARLQERDDHAELLIMRLEEHIVRGLEAGREYDNLLSEMWPRKERQ